MNILFISLSPVPSVRERGIYSDLLREFRKRGHKVSIVTPCFDKKTSFVSEDNVNILKVNTGSILKANLIKKGINTLLIGIKYKKAIKKYIANERFDLVLYPTPPVTIVNVVKYIKKRDSAMTYLMLKDIFPQNAVDLGMMQTSGFKGLIYRYFRYEEKRLYAVSDFIGCMSQANVNYVKEHNPELNSSTIEICPNTIEIQNLALPNHDKERFRAKYGIPSDKLVFVYGGNLGKPQGVPFIIEALKAEKHNDKVFFLIVGDGTEYDKLDQYVKNEKPSNVKLMSILPKDEYDMLVGACDVGLIFLDDCFTIPNYPSRLLSYMQAGLPVLACTDRSTDIGDTIVNGHFGWWCESNDPLGFHAICNQITDCKLDDFRVNSWKYLCEHFSVDSTYNTIMSHFDK